MNLMKRAARLLRRRVTQCPLVPLSVYRKIIMRDVVGLCYHVVSDDRVEHVEGLFPIKQRESFEEHLLYLKSQFRLLSYEELTALRRRKGSSRQPGVILTFDDGLSECYSVVRPLLLKHGIPCVFFVTTDLIDNASMFYRHKAALCLAGLKRLRKDERWKVVESIKSTFGLHIWSLRQVSQWILGLGPQNDSELEESCSIVGVDIGEYLRRRKPYLTAAQVGELISDGFVIGAHGKTHTMLGKLSLSGQEREIVSSTLKVQELTAAKQIPFSFPFSGDNVSRVFLRDLRKNVGAIGLFFDLKGIRDDTEFVVNRIWCESPSLSPSQRSAMPVILRNACQNAWVERFSAGRA